jgi:hypothetical protein
MNIERVTSAIPVPQRLPAKEGAQKLVVGEQIALRYEGRDEHGVTMRRDRGPSLRMPPYAAWAQGLNVGDTVWLRVLATEPSLELEFVSTRSIASGTALSPDELPAMRTDQAAMRIHQWKLPAPGELAAAWRVILASRHMDMGLQSLALMERQPPLPGPSGSVSGGVLQEHNEHQHWNFHLYAWGGMNVTLRVAAKSLWARRRTPTVETDVQGIEVALSLPQAGTITVQLLCMNSGVAMALLPRNAQVIPLLRDLIPELANTFGHLGTPLKKVQLGTPLSPLPPGGLSYRPGPSSSALLLAVAEVVSCVARHWPVPPYADSTSYARV